MKKEIKGRERAEVGGGEAPGKMAWREGTKQGGKGEREEKGGGLRKRKRETTRRRLYKETTVY